MNFIQIIPWNQCFDGLCYSSPQLFQWPSFSSASFSLKSCFSSKWALYKFFSHFWPIFNIFCVSFPIRWVSATFSSKSDPVGPVGFKGELWVRSYRIIFLIIDKFCQITENCSVLFILKLSRFHSKIILGDITLKLFCHKSLIEIFLFKTAKNNNNKYLLLQLQIKKIKRYIACLVCRKVS